MTSKLKKLMRYEFTARMADNVARQIVDLLNRAGLTVRVKAKQSPNTGTVYLKIRVLRPDGTKIKDAGAAIRIADHPKPIDRFTNFARPARRFYGIWIYSGPYKIAHKIHRIAYGIVRRAEEGGEA